MKLFLSDHRFLALFVAVVLAVALIDLVLQTVFHDANWWVVPGVCVGFGVGMWGRNLRARRNE
jgi:hypothetical protein